MQSEKDSDMAKAIRRLQYSPKELAAQVTERALVLAAKHIRKLTLEHGCGHCCPVDGCAYVTKGPAGRVKDCWPYLVAELKKKAAL